MTGPHGRLLPTADEMKTYADHVEGDDGSIRYYLPDTKENRGWCWVGMRLTDCCAAASTYMDDGAGGQELSCKHCANVVELGEGDGSEYRS
tara:strand:+ start:200 stop:472 length:273 start_codon:yes stop_codon:yes gene_type:complete